MAISHVHLVVLLILSLLLLPTLRAIDFSDCGDGSSPVQVTSVEEIVLKDNNKANFTISGSTSKSINGGVIHVDVEIDMTHLFNEKYDLCALMACPVAPGAFVLPLDNIVPFYPMVKIRVRIDIFDDSKDSNHIMCLTFEIQKERSFAVSS